MIDEHLQCLECGIIWGLEEGLFDVWKRDNKKIFCPNGHPNSFGGNTVSINSKDLNELRSEIKELKAKLLTADALVVKQTMRANALELELEIWKPSETKVEEHGSTD